MLFLHCDFNTFSHRRHQITDEASEYLKLKVILLKTRSLLMKTLVQASNSQVQPFEIMWHGWINETSFLFLLPHKAMICEGKKIARALN